MNFRLPTVLVLLLLLLSCQPALYKLGKQYQQDGSLESLEKAVAMIELGTDKATLQKILGTPIDMGFDYRYLTPKLGENNCAVGAVFHFDENGKVDDKWVDEICE